MQTMEAIISFFVFMVFTSYLLMQLEDYNGMDDSLYRYQLANDAWRVLYLQGAFKDVDSISDIDSYVAELSDVTGFCIYVSGQQGTSTRGIQGRSCGDEALAKVSHVLIAGGNPEQVTLSLYPSS